MSNSFSDQHSPSDAVRLSTFIWLRWFAIAGQITAIVATSYFFEIQIPFGSAIFIIGVATITNLVLHFVFPEGYRLSSPAATVSLAFDSLQLSCLLFITGGLHNPFALLLLAPVTIAATILKVSNAAAIGALVIASISILAVYGTPLTDASGQSIAIPTLFVFGYWVSLLVGVIFLALYAWRVTTESQRMTEALFATQMTLERAQKLNDIAGVVAATAHELGSPLATIKLTSRELLDALSDQPELSDDVRLISEQTERCRQILQEMGKSGKSDEHVKRVPLQALLHEAAEPHADRGKTISFSISDTIDNPLRQPVVQRRSDLLHGLRNLIQNAVDFADQNVHIESNWDAEIVRVEISDDGPGFPLALLPRIGEPFLNRRSTPSNDPIRPGYQGMGLGLFISKTLLQATGATVRYSNSLASSAGRGGAVIRITWSREKLDPLQDRGFSALDHNKPYQN